MPNIRQFNAKLMEEKLTENWCIEDFAHYYNLSPDEFMEHVKKNFNSRALDGIIRRLRKNKKMKERKSGSGNQPKISKKKIKLWEDEETQKLHQVEKEIKKEISEKEKDYTVLKSRNNEIVQQINCKKEQKALIMQKFRELKYEIDEMESESGKISVEMFGLEKEIQACKESIKEIEEKINALRKVIIFVYENGEIEIDKPEILVPEDWEEYYEVLLEDNSLENLTIKQMRVLAKTVVTVRDIASKGLIYEVTFESEEVEKAFEKISN